jgi:hypothetical protein
MTAASVLIASVRNRVNISADDARLTDANILECGNAGL